MNVQAKASRDRILDSAGRILVRDGGDAVTIAAVAREAGISKGGLFYHFASKELLIEGLVARYVATFDELLDSAGDDPGAATRAYLRSVEHPGSPATQPVVAMLAAAVVNPASMATLRERYDRWQRRLDDDGVPAHLSATIRFAVDGLWLADTLDLAPAQGESRELIIGTLTTLLDRSSPR
ncbi:TetR/AcrR family transcriptional regulator [Microbacterium sp.]|uniref:TetR/AcrR family transcriptional regulator n=1 Tax=Microbacterium sp. TaxID=51671 RepID=UPI003C71D55D